MALGTNLLLVRTDDSAAATWGGRYNRLLSFQSFPPAMVDRLQSQDTALDQVDDEAEGRAALEAIATGIGPASTMWVEATIALAANGNLLRMTHCDDPDGRRFRRNIHKRDADTGTYRTNTVKRF